MPSIAKIIYPLTISGTWSVFLMEIVNKNILDFNIEWNKSHVLAFSILLIIPNLLGLINISTPWGFNIHFFQVAIFMAAIVYGPKGGLLSGLVGSAYSAFVMANPYIIIGNALLGFFVGRCQKTPNGTIGFLHSATPS